MTLRLIRGGRPRTGAGRPAKSRAPYCIQVNRHGVSYVWFQWSPTSNVFDSVMTLDEAEARGFVAVARPCFDIVPAQVNR